MSKSLKSRKDTLTIKFQSFIFYSFLLLSVSIVFTSDILFLVFLIIFYCLLSGIWALATSQYYTPAGGELRAKMYEGFQARLIGFGYLMVAFVFIYYFW